MEPGSPCCEPRDRRALAQVWICALLAWHLQSPPDGRQKKDFEGSAGSHLSDDRGRIQLGARRVSTASCWRSTRFSKRRFLRLGKRLRSKSNQSKNRLNMGQSDNRLRCAYLRDPPQNPVFEADSLPKSCPGNRLRTFSFLGVQVRWASKLRREGIPKETKGTPENTK